jgi:hypothetical protein
MSQASLAESSISHKNSTGGLRKLFSSPKKNRAVAPRPPPPDPIRQYMDDRGIFAEGIIPYFELAHKCHGRIICHYMNLKSPQNKQQVAKLQFKMFFLPSLPGSPKLPENIKSVECGLQTLKTNNTLAYKGELSQLGGDCKVRTEANTSRTLIGVLELAPTNVRNQGRPADGVERGHKAGPCGLRPSIGQSVDRLAFARRYVGQCCS